MTTKNENGCKEMQNNWRKKNIKWSQTDAKCLQKLVNHKRMKNNQQVHLVSHALMSEG